MCVLSNRVLVLDDFLDNFDIYKKIIENHFESIEVLSINGDNCNIDYIKELNPDLMLINIDNFECFSFCEQYSKDEELKNMTPIILLTSDGSSELITKSFRFGVFDFIKKPVHEELLINKMRVAINIRKEHIDITNKRDEIRILEYGLEKENEFRKAVLDNFPTGIIIFKENSVFYTNKEYYEVFGNEPISNITEFISKFDTDSEEALKHAIFSKGIESISEIQVKKNDEISHVSFKTIPIPDYDCKIVAGWCVDDYVLSEKKSKRSSEFISSILQGIQDDLILIDKNGIIEWSNNTDKYEKGSSIFDTVDLEDELNDYTVENFNSVFETGEPLEIETLINERFYSHKITPCNRNGVIKTVLEIRRDVTQRRESSDRSDLFYIRELVETLNESKNELNSAIISLHEELDGSTNEKKCLRLTT